MKDFAAKLAKKRRDLGITQTDFAEKMMVSRQTVNRWESGAVLPDIEKIADIADILGVSCDYLLKDGVMEEADVCGEASEACRTPGKLIENIVGAEVKLDFCEDETDIDLYDVVCRVVSISGNWIKVEFDNKKTIVEKLIPLSSVASIELVKEAEA